MEDFFACGFEATWTLDRNSMLPHRPEVQEKYILNFETFFFCIVLHHFYRAFESSLQVASLRRGIGVCAMLGEPQLRVRVPRMCQPWWCPAASVVLWRNITGSRDACHFSVERWWQGRWMYFSYIMYVLWYIINDMCNIYIKLYI